MRTLRHLCCLAKPCPLPHPHLKLSISIIIPNRVAFTSTRLQKSPPAPAPSHSAGGEAPFPAPNVSPTPAVRGAVLPPVPGCAPPGRRGPGPGRRTTPQRPGLGWPPLTRLAPALPPLWARRAGGAGSDERPRRARRGPPARLRACAPQPEGRRRRSGATCQPRGRAPLGRLGRADRSGVQAGACPSGGAAWADPQQRRGCLPGWPRPAFLDVVC